MPRGRRHQDRQAGILIRTGKNHRAEPQCPMDPLSPASGSGRNITSSRQAAASKSASARVRSSASARWVLTLEKPHSAAFRAARASIAVMGAASQLRMAVAARRRIVPLFTGLRLDPHFGGFGQGRHLRHFHVSGKSGPAPALGRIVRVTCPEPIAFRLTQYGLLDKVHARQTTLKIEFLLNDT